MRIVPLGDSAWILHDLRERAWVVADRLHALRPAGFIDAASAYDTVGVYFDADLWPWALEDAPTLEAAVSDASVEAPTVKVHVVPVCYSLGEDLELIARTLGLSTDEVIDAHAGETYTCFAIGFQPGFPYLGPLSDVMAGMPRRSQPRVRVEPGSVAITGRQTAIYPAASPGGWAILGRTPLTIVDVGHAYFPIRAGDQVRFEPIDEARFVELEGTRL